MIDTDDMGIMDVLLPDSGDEMSIELEDGGMEIILGALGGEGDEVPFDANLADVLEPDDLMVVGSDLLTAVEGDRSSRAEWIQTYLEGFDLLGLEIEERTEPWDGACGVNHPILAEALIKFQSETIMATFPASGPVKTVVLGKETVEALEAAARVKEDMNYRLTDEMVEYRAEHERALWGLGLSGNAFKKVYFDPSLGRQVSLFVPAEDVIAPYGASNIQTAERVTHMMRRTKQEVLRLQLAGFYRQIDLGEPSVTLDEVETKLAEKMGYSAAMDDRFRLYEVHTLLDLPGFEHTDEDGKTTGRALPYVVTVEATTGTVLAIRRNWVEGDPLYRPRNHFVHYEYVPGFGLYAYGLVHLLGAFAKGGTALLRQLIDAGTLANLPGGYKTRDLRVRGDSTPIAPGEFRDVDVGSGTIADNIYTLPFKEPSPTLFQLLVHLEDQGRRFASIADMKVSDMSAEAPVGTTLALLERQLKVMTAVQARVHNAMRHELKLLKAIIRDHTDDAYEYEPDTGGRRAKRSDYDMVEVLPVSDPNAATMSQRVVQFQAVVQLAAANPGVYDQIELNRRMLDVLDIKDADKLVPRPDDMRPADPVTENMAILKSKPAKAFMYQDHEAHIQTHMAAMQDPKIQALVQQSPQAAAIQAAMAAHLAEHLGYAYRQQMEKQMGMELPHPDEPLPEDVEVRLSRLVAMAGQKLLQTNQAEAAQQAAQQAAEDPVLQMQREELEIKKAQQALKDREQALKERKFALDAAKAADSQELAEKRLALDAAKATDDMALREAVAGADIALRTEQLQEKDALDTANLMLGAVDRAQKAQQPTQEVKPDGRQTRP